MEFLGIKFAPLNVPLSRRLQTLMALFWISSLTCGGLICLIITGYAMFFTSLYPIILLYLAWAYFDREKCHQGGRKVEWVRSLPCWKYFKDFFPIDLKKTCDLPPDKNYLFCVYPHGLLSAGVFGNFATNASDFKKLFPGLDIHCGTLDMHFSMPLFREYILALGAVSASKESMISILGTEDKGKVFVLIVGGAAESLYAHPGNYRLVLKNRKGFIRIALKTGSPLVPVFSFGENELYDQVSNPPGSFLLKVQNWLRKYTGIAPCLPIGRGILQYSFGPIPRRCPLTTVVGKPIDVPKLAEPSQEDVDKYHEMFIKELIKLFEENKKKYLQDPDKAELILD